MKWKGNGLHKFEATEKGVIPVLDAGIHLRKSLCCKKIDYRVKIMTIAEVFQWPS